jgi:hypothetical protein
MDISDILSELADDEERSSPKPPAAGWPYALAVQSQLLPGRTRRCAFWVSAFVPPAMRYVIDTTQLAGRWQHNPAEDAIPADAFGLTMPRISGRRWPRGKQRRTRASSLRALLTACATKTRRWLRACAGRWPRD